MRQIIVILGVIPLAENIYKMNRPFRITFTLIVTLTFALAINLKASGLREAFYKSRMEDKSLSARQRITYMDSLIRLHPDDVDIRKLKSDLCWNIGDYMEAASEYLVIAARIDRKKHEHDALRAMTMAACSMQLGNRPIEASNMALDIFRIDKSDSMSYYDLNAREVLINTTLMGNDVKAAREHLSIQQQEIERLAKDGLLSDMMTNKFRVVQHINMVELFRLEKDFTSAIREAREALKKAAGTVDTVDANILLAKIYSCMGEDEAAINLYRRNIEHLDIFFNRRMYSNDYAEILLKNGRVDEALDVLSAFETDTPCDYIEKKRLEIKGRALREKGDLAGAFDNLRRADEIEDSIEKSGEMLSSALRIFEKGIAQDEMERLTRRGDRWRTATFSVIGGVLCCVVAAILTMVIIRKRKSRIVNQETAADSDESRQLVSAALKMSRISDTIKTIEELASDRSPDALDKISTELKQLDYSENTWEMFRKSFESMHPGFMAALDKDYPGLSINEQRMAAYIVLGLTNKEIASMINRQPRTVETIKYRLRKSLKIPTDVTTIDFLRRYLPIR